MEIEPLNDTNWLSNLIGESPRNCERRRQEGTGPDFVKVGKRVLYRLSDVEEWLRQNTFASTAEAAAAKEREAAELVRQYEEGQGNIAETKAKAARRYPQHKRRREAAGQAKEARE